MRTTNDPPPAASVPLGDLLGRLGRDVVAAQAALDEDARARAERSAEKTPVIAPLAFFYPEVSVDLAVAFGVGAGRGVRALVAAPANPANIGLFGAASFGGRVRVRIAALHPMAPAACPERGDGD
jgi:hypothetical protein